MEPIAIIVLILQQALSTIIELSKSNKELDNDIPSVKAVIDIAQKTNIATGLILKSKHSSIASKILASPLIDAGTSILEILQDIYCNTAVKAEFNRNIIKSIQYQNNVFVCPRSNREIKLFIIGDEVNFSCLYLLNHPPFGCKVAWRKVGSAAMNFPPLVVLPMFKAFFDFSMLSLGVSPLKTYGYCYFADYIISKAFDNELRTI